MQHEPLVHLSVDHFDFLLVFGRAKRHRDQGLGFTTCEHGRSMRAR